MLSVDQLTEVRAWHFHDRTGIVMGRREIYMVAESATLVADAV